MATLTAQNARIVAGKAITFSAAAAGGDRAPVGDGLYLLVKNGSGSTITVTLDSIGSVFNGLAVPDTAITVAAAEERLVPLLRNYQSDTDGLAGVAYSAVTTVTVAVLQV
jgi:hypothetical protein